jgi:hypothetical protein
METHSGDHLTTARNILRDARLEHPNTLLIEVFLDYAVDPQKASEYLVRRCAHNFDCTELGKFLEDWKALVEMCQFLSVSYRGRKLLTRPSHDKSLFAQA